MNAIQILGQIGIAHVLQMTIALVLTLMALRYLARSWLRDPLARILLFLGAVYVTLHVALGLIGGI